MKPYLLDINVLLALAWPFHIHHRLAHHWFPERRAMGFCTCPVTEIGFLRISSNPKFTRKAVSPAEGLALLQEIRSMPEHDFWPDDLPLSTALDGGAAVVGHRQITDAYLLALARGRGGVLATLDRGTLFVASGTPDLVELVGSA